MILGVPAGYPQLDAITLLDSGSSDDSSSDRGRDLSGSEEDGSHGDGRNLI